MKEAKDSPIDLVDSTLVDPVKETLSSSAERVPVHEPDADPDTSDDDTSKAENKDGNVVKDVLEEVSDGNILSETTQNLGENLDKVTDGIDLLEEDEILQGTIDSVKPPDSILKSSGNTVSLTDAVDDTISNLEELISDTNTVKSLESIIHNSVKEVAEVKESSLDVVDEQDITDDLLHEAKDTLREAREQVDDSIIEDILEKSELLTNADEVLDDIDAESIQDGIAQSVQNTDALDAEKLLTQPREKLDAVDEMQKTVSSMELEETSDADPEIPQQDPLASMGSAGSRVKEIALNREEYRDIKVISNPELTQEEERHITD